MNASNKLFVILKVIYALVFKKRIPLAVSWNITYKCNLRCGYCGAHEKNVEELDTKSVLSVVSEFAALGAKLIKFSGGEPLLRADIGEIIEFCRHKKLGVLINSNGTLVKKRIDELSNIEEIQLSLDGTKDVHDYIRGAGVFDKVIEAIELCKSKGVKVIITSVISRYNTSCVPFLLDLAEKYNVGIQFHPVDQIYSTNSSKDIRLLFSPIESEFKKAITYIIGKKKGGSKSIHNSVSALRHIYHWPHPRKVKCLLEMIHCHVEPDGKIFICSEFPGYQQYLVKICRSYKEAFYNLGLPYKCKECWSSDAEYCMCADLKLDSIFEMWERFLGR
jgi:MoaA/NifB/PqqE/SkfB family radical SAM enzyme